MRKKLHTLLALLLLSAATLAVSCNKDNKDPEFKPKETPLDTTISEGAGYPNDTINKYYFNKTSRILFKREGKTYTAIQSLKDYNSGNKIYLGTNSPKPSSGENNDFFVNTKIDIVYEKKQGVWKEVDGEVYIRDPKFRAALLATGNNNGSVDGNGDGKISITEVRAVQALRVSNADIDYLDGVELFSNITVLEAKSNKLTTVHLESLSKLKQIDLTGNQLSGTLDLSKSTNLQNGKINIVANNNNPQLQKIIVSDVAKATALNNSERTNKYTATGEVDQIIEFDPVVKTAIIAIGNTGPDRNGDGEISISEALAYTKRIDITLPGVQSLKGLEKFKNISALRIFPGEGRTNDLTDKNFSLTDFPNMETLDITNTTLEELAVKSFPKLTRISIVNGNLNKVTITETTELKQLSLERNNLTALPVTFFDGLTKLTAINLLGNNIAGDINLVPVNGLEANAGAIQIMRTCRLCTPTLGNTQVRYIYVKTQAEASALNGADGTGVYKSNADSTPQEENPVVTIADANLRSLVWRTLRTVDFNAYRNYPVDGPYRKSDLAKITTLEIDNNITNITGLESFTGLKKLDLRPQGPTTLDLTAMQELEEITLGGTMATITGSNVSLKKVILKENRNVTKLDLRGFRNIEKVFIEEQSTTPNHIECIAVPANKVEDVKASINISAGGGNADLARQKTELYRSKVQSTPCN